MLTLPVGEASSRHSSSSSFTSFSSHMSKAVRPEACEALRDALQSRREDGGRLGGEEEEEEEEGDVQRRGSRKKKLSQARQDRMRLRRVEANARERSRMHGLNQALDGLRRVVPCCSTTQKLSKIETLRLAKNYIWALSQILSSGTRPDLLTFVQALCKGLSQPTANLVAACLQLSARSSVSHRGAETFSLRPAFPLLAVEGGGTGPAEGGRPPRPLASLCGPYRRLYGSPSPRSCSPLHAGTLSPPVSFSGIFSFKQEESAELGSCHHGLRCCSISPPGGSAHIGAYGLHLRQQLHRVQEELDTPLHNHHGP